MRKLATIREIKEIKSIDGADKIECAVIDGWECVVAKQDGFKVGDLVVYFEIDSILPDRPEFEFMRSRKFRVKTIRLKQQISQGLAMPLTILPNKKWKLGDDVSDIVGVKKFDPQAEQEAKMMREKKAKHPVIKFLMRYRWFRKLYVKPKKGGFPAWIVKTDEERLQNKTEMFRRERDRGTNFVITEKLDGQSITLFIERIGRKKYDFGVCSRNLRLKTPDDSSWWTIARQIDAENVLKDILRRCGDNRIVIQGEIIGSGIQKNKYKVNGYDFYAFNLIIDGNKQSAITMREILEHYNIKTVPILETEFKLKDYISEMVEYAKGSSVLHKTKREGVVARNYDRDISFKVINPEFLLAEKD